MVPCMPIGKGTGRIGDSLVLAMENTRKKKKGGSRQALNDARRRSQARGRLSENDQNPKLSGLGDRPRPAGARVHSNHSAPLRVSSLAYAVNTRGKISQYVRSEHVPLQVRMARLLTCTFEIVHTRIHLQEKGRAKKKKSWDFGNVVCTKRNEGML